MKVKKNHVWFFSEGTRRQRATLDGKPVQWLGPWSSHPENSCSGPQIGNRATAASKASTPGGPLPGCYELHFQGPRKVYLLFAQRCCYPSTCSSNYSGFYLTIIKFPISTSFLLIFSPLFLLVASTRWCHYVLVLWPEDNKSHRVPMHGVVVLGVMFSVRSTKRM